MGNFGRGGGRREGSGRRESGGFDRDRESGGGFRRDFGPREMHDATCSECGQECKVPFKPTAGRQVFCGDCWSKRRRF